MKIDTPWQGPLALVGFFGGTIAGVVLSEGASELARFVLIVGGAIGGAILGTWIASEIDKKN